MWLRRRVGANPAAVSRRSSVGRETSCSVLQERRVHVGGAVIDQRVTGVQLLALLLGGRRNSLSMYRQCRLLTAMKL